jgi:uncharacterized protein
MRILPRHLKLTNPANVQRRRDNLGSANEFQVDPGAGAPNLNTIEFTLLVTAGSFIAGMLGSLTGLGGGVVIVPLLTLVFGVDIRYAIGASLVSVIATSSGAAAAYLREGYSNMRVGMFLEIATTVGALSGAFIAAYISTSAIAVIFGVVLLYSAYASLRSKRDPSAEPPPDRLATYLKLDGSYPAAGADGSQIVARGDGAATQRQPYHVRNVPAGFSLMYVAGVLSGLLGIGSGAVKVLAMDQAMKLPFKVSTTTSNFMIGVTAAASAGIYLRRGYIDPGLALPVVLGVLGGALTGALILPGAKVRTLRMVFGAVIAALGVQMIFEGLKGKL